MGEGYGPAIGIPTTIECPDCGSVAHLMTTWEPDVPAVPGDIATYRCEDCLDAWYMELDTEDIEDIEGPQPAT